MIFRYINKSLGTLITESPYTVRLNFEPVARARGEVGEFYKLPKRNQCVVCGAIESFNRKNIVPREYRKHFPDVMKSHSSHDIVLLCPHCNRLSSSSDMKVRLKLAVDCDAPFLLKEGCLPRVVHSVQLKYARKLKANFGFYYLRFSGNADLMPKLCIIAKTIFQRSGNIFCNKNSSSIILVALKSQKNYYWTLSIRRRGE